MQDLEKAGDVARRIIENVNTVIIGKQRAVELGVIALMCQGHALIEDVPGVGKTMLAKSIARSSGSAFKRIQFTPDLLPTDITGVSIYNQKTGEFEFREGPIISQIVLADEINRATPKTQSALLEAMEEQQVTVEGITHPIPSPFIVLATQNPIEYEGTFPLPEAQLDRFLLAITLGYPSSEDALAILDNQQLTHPIESLQPITTADEICELQKVVKKVYVDDLIKQYIVMITEATRDHPDIALGSSPRGSLGQFRTAQALAMIRGRDFVLPDDIKELAIPVIAHRLIVSATSRMRGIKAQEIVSALMTQIPVPGAEGRRWFRS